MGLRKRRRSFSDQYMWAARTIQPKVSALSVNDPQIDDPDFPECLPDCKRKDFHRTTGWSYAFPLEIVWLTPLSKWNPYEIEYKINEEDNIEVPDRVVKDGAEDFVTANNRNG